MSLTSLTTGCILHTMVSNNPPVWHLTLFLLATLPFNQNQSPALGTRPGTPSPPFSLSSLPCPHGLLVLSPLPTEPEPGRLSATRSGVSHQASLLQGKVDFSWVSPYSDLCRYRPFFVLNWQEIGNSSGVEGKFKRALSVSTKLHL